MTEIRASVDVDLRALIAYQNSIDNQLAHRENGPVEKALKKWAWRYRSFVQLRFDTYSKGGGNWPPLADVTVARRRKKGGGTHGDTMKRIAKLEVKLAATGKPKVGKKTRTKSGNVSVSQGKTSGRKKKRRTLASAVKAARKSAIKRSKTAKAKAKLRGTISKLKKSIRTTILRNIGLLFQALQPTFGAAPGALEQNIPFGIRVGYGGPATHPGSKLSVADIAAVHNDGLGHVPRRQIIVMPNNAVINAMGQDMDKALKQLSMDSAKL